jgi:hypothetical protein
VGLERSPLSLVSTTEESLERKSSDSGLETENTALGIRHADHVALYQQKLAPISPTSGFRSVGIVRSRTKATEFLTFIIILHIHCMKYCNMCMGTTEFGTDGGSIFSHCC